MYKKGTGYLFLILITIMRHIHAMQEIQPIIRSDRDIGPLIRSTTEWENQIVYRITRYRDSSHEHPLATILYILPKDKNNEDSPFPILEIDKMGNKIDSYSEEDKTIIATLVQKTISFFFNQGFDYMLMNTYTYQNLYHLEITKNLLALPTEDGAMAIFPPEQ